MIFAMCTIWLRINFRTNFKPHPVLGKFEAASEEPESPQAKGDRMIIMWEETNRTDYNNHTNGE